MKIILSRKGFDSANGECPNPIFPDGTMLSLPIPSEDKLNYKDIVYNGMTYEKLLMELNPGVEYKGCHLDPDIRCNVRTQKTENWKPAFGQINQAQTYLMNAGVEEGDLFLFFGRFQDVIKNIHGEWMFNRKSPIKHIIYGYLQVGKVLTAKDDIEAYYWHPHASDKRINNPKNALYIPSDYLQFNREWQGYGVWNYDERRVLTLDGFRTATWKDYSFLQPQNIFGNRKNSAKTEGLYYAGIWQELVIKENIEATEWAIQLFNAAPAKRALVK